MIKFTAEDYRRIIMEKNGGMTPKEVCETIIVPSISEMVEITGHAWLDTYARRRLLLAIAIQESNLETRVQIGGGPGRSFWQLEAGVRYLFSNEATSTFARSVCRFFGVSSDTSELAKIMETSAGDDLACCLAILMLMADPHPIPTGQDDAWKTYLRVWRPGKPRPDAWPRSWSMSGVASFKNDKLNA